MLQLGPPGSVLCGLTRKLSRPSNKARCSTVDAARLLLAEQAIWRVCCSCVSSKTLHLLLSMQHVTGTHWQKCRCPPAGAPNLLRLAAEPSC
jgi:hypothetical protein